MSNHNQLCRDGIFGNLQIKSKKVLDKNANLDVKNAKIRGDAKVKGALTVCGPILFDTAKKEPIVFVETNGKYETTLTITEPGWYELQHNVSFEPLAKNSHAIVVASDDVIVDLCGKVLEQSNSTTSIIGIKVLSGHTNITILGSNGSIRNFSQLGISIDGDSKNIHIGDDHSALHVNGCGYGTPTSLIDDDVPQYQGGIHIGDSEYLAAQGFPSVNGTIESLSLTNVFSERNAMGMWLGYGSEYTFTGSSFSYNFEDRLLGATILGEDSPVGITTICFGLTTLIGATTYVDRIKIDNCKFNQNSVAGGNDAIITSAGGVNMGYVRNMVVSNSSFDNNNITAIDVALSQTSGIVFAADCFVADNCTFCGNKGPGQVEGFHISGFLSHPTGMGPPTFKPPHSTTLRNCVASNNVCDSDLASGDFFNFANIASGFTLFYVTGATVLNCVGEGNEVKGAAIIDPVGDGFFFAGGLMIIGTRFAPNPEFTATHIDIDNFHGNKNRSRSRGGFDVGFKRSMSGGIVIFDDGVENVTARNCVLTENEYVDDMLDAGDRVYEGGFVAFSFDGGAQNPVGFMTVQDCIASKHGQGFGIILRNQGKGNTILRNVCKDNDVGIGLVSAHEECDILQNICTNNSTGIQLLGNLGLGENTGNSVCCSIMQNTVTSNDIGISDSLVPSTSLVAQNKAFNNDIIGYDVNYGTLMDPVGPSIVSGNLISYPTGGEVCDNVDFIKTGTRSISRGLSRAPLPLPLSRASFSEKRPTKTELCESIRQTFVSNFSELSSETVDKLVVVSTKYVNYQ